MHFKYFLTFGIITALFASCSNDSVTEEGNDEQVLKIIELSSSKKDIVNNYNKNVIKTYAVMDEDNMDNLLYSSASLLQFLGMSANGAQGTTQSQLFNYIGSSNLDDINDLCAQLHSQLGKVDKKCRLEDANSVWVQTGLSMNDGFKERLTNVFGADVFYTNLSSNNFVAQINSWCSERTKGLINNLLSEPKYGCVIDIVNTIYFKGQWSVAFSKGNSKQGTFYNIDESSVYSIFMRNNFNKEQSQHYCEHGLQAIKLNYGKGGFSFIATDIPVKTPDDYERLMNGFQDQAIYLEMPRLALETDAFKLKEALSNSGLVDMWEREKADFSATGINNIYFENIIHKVKLVIDEEGTVIASASSTHGNGAYMPDDPIPVIFDHPYTVIVKENSTGLIIFIGKVNRL